jgi:beta-lactamase class A
VLKGGIAVAAVGVIFVVAGAWAGFTLARPNTSLLPPVTSANDAATPVPAPARQPAFDDLRQSVARLLGSAGATGAVTLAELGGDSRQTWSLNGDQEFVAASTYKLPLLMEEAQKVTAGTWHGTDSLCYQDGDWEDGYYSDYDTSTCMSRSQLEHRVGLNSDNTAAHMLVRYAGGTAALNSYARAHGAQRSTFYVPNTTTTNDLARLLVDESESRAGGRSAQQYLYPMLTHTSYESGIPAGVPPGTVVVHKIGVLDGQVNDVALVPGGPHGPYVLAICTQGPGGDAGWKLLADISRVTWQLESAR